MTPNEAKQLVATKLQTLGLPAHKLTAKTVNFGGLGYGEKLFVTIHGWQPSPLATEFKRMHPEFIVEFK